MCPACKTINCGGEFEEEAPEFTRDELLKNE